MHTFEQPRVRSRMSFYFLAGLASFLLASLTHGQPISPAPINFVDYFGRTPSDVDQSTLWDLAANPAAELEPATSFSVADSQFALTSNPAPVEVLAELIDRQAKIRSMISKILPCVVSVAGGSGVVVTSSGVILTASHVTRKSGQLVNVRFSDGRVVQATTLGTNYNNDTAALKLNSPGPWPHLAITDSTNVQPGDWCLALGYPISFPRGKPAAIRLGRVLKIAANQFVTDCPIMGGDSGGPLLNMNGNLIGINSRVKSEIEDNVHIPVQLFLDDWKQLAASKDVWARASPTGHRAYLGIQGETDRDCVRIRSVHRGSPAESAGLLAEDVLLQLDGKPIGTFNDVLDILDMREPGERVVADLNRFGKLLSVPIKLGKQY